MKGYLKSVNWVFQLESKRTTVGKHKDSDLCLQNGGVDEFHAIIEWCEAAKCYAVRDLNSAHGTYVNDCRIHNATVRLSPGDQLHFGFGGSAYELSIDSEKPFAHFAAPSAASQAWTHARTLSSSSSPHKSAAPLSSNSLDAKKQSSRSGSNHSSCVRGHLRSKSQPHTSQSIPTTPVEQDESQMKNDVITALKEEVSDLKLKLSKQKKQSNTNLTSRLRCLESDIKEKKDQIQLLHEQMLDLQRSSRLMPQSLIEREQKITSLSGQLEKQRKKNNSFTVMVSSLQSDLTSREKQVLKLSADIDKLKQDVQLRDGRLACMTDKLKNSKDYKEQLLAKQNEAESVKKEQETLQEEIDRLKQLLQETKQKKKTVQAELRNTQSRFDSFRKRIIKTANLNLAKETDQLVLERLSMLMKQMEKHKSKVQEFEMKLKDSDSQMFQEAHPFKVKLEECQGRVLNAYAPDQLQKEISALESLCLSPAASWVQTHFLAILNFLHTVLQSVAKILQSAGVNMSENSGGVIGAFKFLQQHLDDKQSELMKLKSEIQGLREKERQSKDRLCRLETVKKQFEMEKVQAALEEKELKNTLMHQLKEAQADLQSVRQSESALRSEIETREAEWFNAMEETKMREEKMKEAVEEERNKRLKESEEREEQALQRGAEEAMERRRESEEREVQIEEYREQVRQHAYTIVALESQVHKAKQVEDKWREMEEHKDSLEQQLKGLLTRLEDYEVNNPYCTSETQQEVVQTISSLQASLAASEEEVVSQSELISALSRDLAQAHAQISDMTGELEEEHKMELEDHRALVGNKKVSLSALTPKLTVMSQLVERKEQEKRNLRARLRLTEMQRKTSSYKFSAGLLQPRRAKDVTLLTAPNDLINQGSKHKGHRRRKAMLPKQEGLGDIRERIRAQEQKWPSKRLAQQGASEKQGLVKTQRLEKSLSRSHTPVVDFRNLDKSMNEAAWERTVRLDTSDSLELSERTYLELANVLREALNLSEGELSGCASLKHLPPDERRHLASLRQTDLQFLRSRLDLQNSQIQRQERLLQENQKELEELREAQVEKLQAALEEVKAKYDSQKQETEQLCQTLKDGITHLQRNQSHSKNNQPPPTASSTERRERVGHQHCIPEKPVKKRLVHKKQKTKVVLEGPTEELEPRRQKDCSMLLHLDSLLQNPAISSGLLVAEAN